jgi:neopullulanase
MGHGKDAAATAGHDVPFQYGNPMTEPETPDWVRDAVFYQIFPDRFAKSVTVFKPAALDAWGAAPAYHGYQGGDLTGVVERLDYLSDLGINAISFTPIFQSASNHRYHTHDYEKVDPMLGGNNALRRLLDEAHARRMYVVLDGVFNHAGRGFFPFHDILENGPNAAYRDWFIVKGFPLQAYESQTAPNYQAWSGLRALPKFNIASRDVREFLWGVAVKWIEFGIDGWRLDVANEIDDDAFWREFRVRVRRANPEAYIVGEVWSDAKRWLKGDMWDAVMNYQFTRACIAYFIGAGLSEEELRKTSLYPPGPATAEAFRGSIERLLALYHPNVSQVMLNLLGSHDTARFLTLARGDKRSLRLATLFQMTYLGAPSLYYGDEIGMTGGHDPANRGAFPWHKPETWDIELLHEFQRLVALRRQRPALRRGSFQFLWARDGIIAYARQLDDETIVVVINSSDSAHRIDLPVSSVISGEPVLHECWTHDSLRVEDGMLRGLPVAPRAGRVMATS